MHPLNHYTTPEFWHLYNALPEAIQRLADKNYALLSVDPNHPSLQFKKIGSTWSVRIGLHYRALALERTEGFVWFWIGSHGEYNNLI